MNRDMEMILESIRANMLEILNKDLVECDPGSYGYESAMEAFEKLVVFHELLSGEDFSEFEQSIEEEKDFNIFNDVSKVEDALREASIEDRDFREKYYYDHLRDEWLPRDEDS